MDWYKHNAAKFTASTAHMSFAERGCYITLLDCQWERRGYLPSDEAAIFRMVGAVTAADQKVVRVVLAEKFDLTENGYANWRMLETFLKAEALREKRSNAGKASARARAATDEGTRVQTPVPTHESTEGGSTRARARRASLTLSSVPLDSSSEREEPEKGDEQDELRWRLLNEFQEAFGVTVSPGGCGYLDERLAAGGTYEEAMAVLRYVQQRPGYQVGRPNDVWSASNWNAVHARPSRPPKTHGPDGLEITEEYARAFDD